jgi:hypothetical protein
MTTISATGVRPAALIGRKLLVATLALALALAYAASVARPAHAAAFSWDVNNTGDAQRAAGLPRATCDSTLGPGICTLRAALEEASQHLATDTFTVTLHTATYSLTAPFGELVIDRGVTLKGDGPSLTVIDHGPNPSLYRVLEIQAGGGGLPVSLTGLAIQNGNVTGFGGGILIDAGVTVSMTAVSILSNTATLDGGGIENNGTLTMTNSRVNGNTSTTGSGGGIADGGAGSSLALTNVVVSNNSVQSNCGGGVAVFGQGNFTDSTFDSNSATGAGGCGGGLWLDGTVGNVNRVTFRNNQVGSAGVFAEGGGLDVDTTGSVTNSTFNGNTSSSDASAIAVDGTLSLLNVTIAGNTAAGAGGGAISHFGIGVADVTLKNTLIANNVGGDCATGDALTSQGHNLVGGTTCNAVFTANATDIKNAGNPGLGPLASNGGPTQTMALLAGSPAIDKGDNVGCPATDQRGVTRPATAANPCDIGAYEFVAAPPPGLPNTGAPAPQPWSPWMALASTLAVPVLTLTGFRLKRRRAAAQR